MRYFLYFLFLFQTQFVVSQLDTLQTVKIDSLYREDHFYLGVTYNAVQNKPNGFAQNSFSPGFSFGYLRDIPLNKNRTFAIAPGLGFAYLGYKANLVAQEVSEGYNYSLEGSFKSNLFSQYFIEAPIEIRWRNSTPESHRFFRIYTGFKVGYLLYDTSKFDVDGQTERITNNKDLNQFAYGAYMAIGYNTINLYVYYGLNPIFKSTAKLNDRTIDVRTLNIGLQFYIL
ncbi:porin family protein [Flavobacterium orientale]|uniref:Outer membrane protein beta-barrel domain-containing protein n=1 Tax=Flavobacterium orientale TaxID=1756020 RepID=A0A917DAX0_9FLAO|nr:porin family protein [Flavobacterium orientale]GGD19039.1 hypothetical protein GCM10011343_07000 [Flavobacterium orientale]